MANGWLAVGAKVVFAYGHQLFEKTMNALFDPTTDYTMEAIFRIPGRQASEFFGWVGWDARRFASVRTPGATNFLDPSANEGFLRAVTGNLTMTVSQWKAGIGSPDAPTMRNLAAATDGAAAL